MNLPNQITLARLGIAIVFCILLATFEWQNFDQDRWMLDVAFWLFVIGAVTDFLDGYLARKNNQVTALGRVMDPFVDKVLVGGGFVLFLGTGFVDAAGHNVTGLTAWMVLIIIARELLVTGMRSFSESAGKAYGANVWGKTKMVVQSVAVGWVISSISFFRHQPIITQGRPFILWIAIGITVVSVIAYMPASRAALLEPGRE